MVHAFENLTQAAMLFAAIFVITAIGLAIVRRYRGGAAESMATSSEMMSNFRELHEEGGLSDEEFRTIKTKLAGKLKSELNGNRGNG